MSENNKETEEERKNREAWAVSVSYDYGGTDFNLSLADIYNTVASGTAKPTMRECTIFMKLCEVQKLNPFLNEAYLIKYTDKKPATIVVSKDLFEKRADSFPAYDGKQSGVIVQRGEDVIELEGAFKLDDDILLGGWCIVYRSDRKQPTTIKVSYAEYVGKKSNGEVNQQWKGKPLTMIRKVAVAQCLREAFPKNFEGMFVQEEMDSSSNPTDLEAVAESSKETKSPLEEKFNTSKAVDADIVSEEHLGEVQATQGEGLPFDVEVENLDRFDDNEDGRMGGSNG